VIVDTGVLYAAIDADDAQHERSVDVLRRTGPKVITDAIVVETDWLVQRRLGVDGEVGFLDGLAGGSIVVEPLQERDRSRARELIAGYRDARIGYVDATTVAVAERLGERVIATLDRRHFQLIKPRHTEAFEIVP